MKILFLIERLPYPLVGGDRLHIYHYLKELKELGHQITVVSNITNGDDLEGALKDNSFYTKLIPIKFNHKWGYIRAIKAIFTGRPFISEYYYNSSMQKAIGEEIATGNYDVVIGHVYRSLPYIRKLKNIKKIIHICDAFSMKYQRRIETKKSLWEKFKIYCEYMRVKKAERECCKYSDKQILISNADLEYITSFADTSKASVIGLATDTEYFKPVKSELKNSICFVGAMWTIPNWQAATFFATKVFPLIKNEIPDAEFKIIGANPKQELYEMAKNTLGIKITGKVDDVREYMKDCKVSVCPTQIASGIQNKILEAMSMGIPVVTTPEGSEGIGASNDILQIASEPQDFADKVIKIMKNADLQQELSQKSREFIVTNFSWKRIGEQWDKEIINI